MKIVSPLLISGISVGTLDRHTVEGGIIVGDEGIKLQGEIIYCSSIVAHQLIRTFISLSLC